MPDFSILKWIRRCLTEIDKQVIIPFSQWLAVRLSRRARAKSRAYQMLPDGIPDWKDKAREDFSVWLGALPDVPPAGEATTMDSCDLYTLLAEFSALRQEIKIQSKEQAKSIKTLSAFIDSYQKTSDLFEEAAALFQKRTNNLADLERRIRQDTEKRAITPFLDVRDTLVRGHRAAQAVAASKSILRSSPKGIGGIVEGYEMALRRFDRALALANIYPVNTLHQPFDSGTMKAVNTRSVPGLEKGIVIEEQLGGFVMEDEVLRTAEVVVSK